jgi:voltage-gated potassium channel
MIQEKVRVWLNEPDTLVGWVYRSVLVLMVLAVCVTFVWETYPISNSLRNALFMVNRVITVLFLLDYLVRFWSMNFSIRYLFTPLALVDLLAILPLFLSANWQFVRVLRLLRILRLLRVLQRQRPNRWRASEFHLRLVTILFTLFCIVFISAGMIYEVEHKHNPSQIRTFFDSLYFAVVSMTTVGYGDITPVSTEGRVITLFMITAGMILIPWQLTEILRYLVRSTQKTDSECEKCNYRWHDPDAHYCKMCGHKLPFRRRDQEDIGIR